jgi:DNA-binding NarL/FixJ family response regulator
LAELTLALGVAPFDAETAPVYGDVGGGLTADLIARKLGIKATSVITHRKRAYDRLGVSGHFELLSLYHATF